MFPACTHSLFDIFPPHRVESLFLRGVSENVAVAQPVQSPQDVPVAQAVQVPEDVAVAEAVQLAGRLEVVEGSWVKNVKKV